MFVFLRKAPAGLNLSPPLILVAGLFVFIIFLYWQTSSQLVTLWNTNNSYSHGLLVLILSTWMIYKKNNALFTLSISPAPILLLPLIGSLILWLIATITDTKTIELTLLPLVFFTAYSCIVGFRVSYLLAPSLLYLLLATPIWEVLVPFFQTMAVIVNEFALQIVGIPTYINDTVVTIPAGSFEIKGGCSGIRFLLVTLALGFYYSISNFKSLKLAIILIAASFIFPVVFNWVRIYTIILAGHISNMESSLMKDHEMFGWYLYAISLIPWFFLARYLSNKENDNNNTQEQHDIVKPNYPKLFIGLVILLLSSAPALVYYLKNAELDTLKNIPTVTASTPWLGPVNTNLWKPNYQGATLELNKLFIGSDDNSDISLHIKYYGRQSQDNELINEDNTITESLHVTEKNNITINSHRMIELVFIEKNIKRIAWYWFQVDNKSTTRAIVVKLLQFKELISGKSRSSLVTLSSTCSLDCSKEKSSMKHFLETHYTKIISSTS